MPKQQDHEELPEEVIQKLFDLLWESMDEYEIPKEEETSNQESAGN